MNVASMVGIEDYNEQVIQVPLFQLLQWRSCIGLELKGLTHSKGSVTAHVRRKLSAPTSYTREQLHIYLSGCIDSINEQLGVVV